MEFEPVNAIFDDGDAVFVFPQPSPRASDQDRDYVLPSLGLPWGSRRNESHGPAVEDDDDASDIQNSRPHVRKYEPPIAVNPEAPYHKRVFRHSVFHVPEGNVTIRISMTEFKIPSYPLVRDSPYFRDAFAKTDNLVIHEQGEIHDFAFTRLLTVIFRPSYTEESLSTTEEWTSVLALSTKWAFTSIRALAIRHLAALTSPIDKLLLAREHHIPDWLLPAHRALCLRDEGPSDAEIERLTWPVWDPEACAPVEAPTVQDLVAIFRAREKVRGREVVVEGEETVDAIISAEVDIPGKGRTRTAEEDSECAQPCPQCDVVKVPGAGTCALCGRPGVEET